MALRIVLGKIAISVQTAVASHTTRRRPATSLLDHLSRR
jgi:hypothetical protein